MRIRLQIGGTTVLLTAAQLDALVQAVDGCERETTKTVKNGNGGYNYLTVLDTAHTPSWLSVQVMSQADYDALKAVTKMQDTTT